MHHSTVSKYALALLALLALPSAGEAPGGHLAASTGTLVILGASYAKGWGEPSLPGYVRVINLGVGGEETGDMLKRFDTDVVATHPQAVLIWGHVNDITRSSANAIESKKAAARRNYVQMLGRARASGIDVILATEVPWTESTGMLNAIRAWIGQLRGKTSYAVRVSAHVHELNDFLKQQAAEQDLTLLDFEHVFVNESGTRKPEFAAADGSHISKAGYAALSKYAQAELKRRNR